jgi:cellobiose phosphorylase
MDPPYHAHAFDGALAVIYNQGTKENAGIFSQSQGWLILAEALCGHGERAFTYFMENAPAAWNDHAEIRRLEPYCYGQFTEGRASGHPGRSHVHWLTGTASTVMVGCVEGILGLRPDLDGIKISPSIPKDWAHLEIEKDFRGKHLHIVIDNPNQQENGCEKLIVNDKEVGCNYIPETLLEETNQIQLIL